jgi:D-alanine-D-alanine ligase
MTGKKLKVAVLYDLWEEEPAEQQEEAPAPRKRKGQKKHKKKIVKEDREEIFEALEKLGHEPSYYVLDGRPQSLLGLAKCGADLVFNLTESYAGDDTKEMHVAAFLDLLEIPYTGSGPHATMLAQDKTIAKKIFAFHGIQSPYFATAYRGTLSPLLTHFDIPLQDRPMTFKCLADPGMEIDRPGCKALFCPSV